MSQAIVPPSATPFSAPAITAGGINGLGSLRFVGTINGGPPTSGTYNTGDVVLDLSTLLLWICTSGGTPGTWTSLSYLRTDSGAPNPQTMVYPPMVSNTLGNDRAYGVYNYASAPSSNSNMQNFGGVQWCINNQAVATTVLHASTNSSGSLTDAVWWLWSYPLNTAALSVDLYQKQVNIYGYQAVTALSGGYKVQSGQFTTPNINAYNLGVTVNYPVAFTSTPIVLLTPTAVGQFQLSNSNYAVASIVANSSTSFMASINQTGSTIWYWMAIGS